MCVAIDSTSNNILPLKRHQIEREQDTRRKKNSTCCCCCSVEFIIGYLKEPLKYCNISAFFFCVFLFFFARQDSARTFMKTMDEKIAFLWFVICFNYGIQAAGIMDNVVFAVNCGGEAHTDVHGNERNFVFDSFVLNERWFLKE